MTLSRHIENSQGIKAYTHFKCLGVFLKVILFLIFLYSYFFVGERLNQSWRTVSLDSEIALSTPAIPKEARLRPQVIITFGKATNISSWRGNSHLYEHRIDREGPSTFLQTGGIVPLVNRAFRELCSLSLLSYCHSFYIADVIDTLWSINPIFVPDQKAHQKRYRYHQDFVSYMRSFGISTINVEGAMLNQGQKFLLTRPGNEPWDIQLNMSYCLNYRENMVNVGIRKAKPDWQYVLWIDSHQIFSNLYWWEETIYKLEHYATCHLASHGNIYDDLNRTREKLPTFTYLYSTKAPINESDRSNRVFNGNLWGIRREIYEKIGYIYDYCLTGDCDGIWVRSTLKSPNDWDGLLKTKCILKAAQPWINKTASIIKGSSTYIRGEFTHLNHERFNNGVHLKFYLWERLCPDLERDFYRDSNFTLFTTNQDLINETYTL